MPIYMKYDSIDGQVSATGFEKCIEVESIQFGVSRHVSSSGGRGANREAGAPSISDITVSKYLDSASTGLFKASLFGEGKTVTISFLKTSQDGKTVQPYLAFELENTLISNYSVSGHGGTSNDHPMESLSLAFTKISWTYTESDAKNKAAKPSRANWDLAAGKGA